MKTTEVADPVDAADKIRALEDRNAELRKDKRKTTAEVRVLQEEVRTMAREVQRLTVELEKMKHPPLIVGTVLDILVDGRVIIKSSTGPNFVVPSAEFVDKERLKPGTRVSLAQNTLTVVGVLPGSRDPVVAGAEVGRKPDVTYAQIGGMDEVIAEVRETVEYPLTRASLFAELGITPPKGVLLQGPPGTGKTMLAKAVANATDATFIRLVAPELVQKFIGEGARRVREVFEMAREKAPSIIFIDEIDALGARRTDDGTSSNREVERTLMQLLAELDGFEPRGDVRIIAATNRADVLDPALLRPGRFDRVIDVPLPTPEGVRGIIALHTKGIRLGEDVDLDDVVARTGPISGADIQSLCTEAGMRAVRNERPSVLQEDFLAAVRKLQRGDLDVRQPGSIGLYA